MTIQGHLWRRHPMLEGAGGHRISGGMTRVMIDDSTRRSLEIRAADRDCSPKPVRFLSTHIGRRSRLREEAMAARARSSAPRNTRKAHVQGAFLAHSIEGSAFAGSRASNSSLFLKNVAYT